MQTNYTAFDGAARVASGALAVVAERCKALLDGEPNASPIIYDDSTGRPVDVDYRGTTHDVLARLPLADETPARRGPGRPKLGVVAREVTLLPRHWEWLASQPGGASVALRRLVENATRENVDADRARVASEAVDRVMLALAGNLAGYEEASRAFHRRDGERFRALIEGWPADVRDYVRRLADVVLS
ncbi:DUF2239 family protein [Luteibacter aegosomatissinici]|uniref:DUF2239 family protein n=1 Tax=Luteibacter aegosomatissinici TaxID=2911539 RepID=UPI001FFBD47D|nr:DUF2239 family protein [Luteibacter aegosomatissinici]UPG94410.1 DUF2239 family protein [Luteibacter aegosomatissinici]